MISPFNPRACLPRAIYPVNQCVSVGTGSLVGFRLKLSSKNLPVVIRGQYRTAAASSSQAGSDDWSRTLQPLKASGSSFDRGRGTRPVDLNLGRFLTGWSSRIFRALNKPSKQTSRVFAVLNRPGPFVGALLHARNKAWRTKHDVQRKTAAGA